MSESQPFPLRVFAPDATSVEVGVHPDGDVPYSIRLTREHDDWVGSVPVGSAYSLRVDGEGKRFDPRRSLLDPAATAVQFSPMHSRDAARPPAPPNHELAPRALAAPWPSARPQRRTDRRRVVYEAHVRGTTMRREHSAPGTYRAMIDELPRLAAMGVSVLELMPVHQADPDEGSYWGYMPLVFGAAHAGYATGGDPLAAAQELADLAAAAHEHDIELWLDVVLNHTTEETESGPTYSLRGLSDSKSYVHIDGSIATDGAPAYVNDAGCGNIVDATEPAMQRLLLGALDRFADLGVDGFRFDLTAVLARSPEFVRRIGDWAVERSITLVAEPWDLGHYMMGRAFPDPRWLQWNDRFRNDMRGFLRGEPGLVAAVMRRIEGSPDLFDEPSTSVNFLTAHDGFTMYDLVAYDHKHNLANGWDNGDGSSNNRSWNCGWEGDAGVPDEVMMLRRRQLRNAMALLMLSHGTPMFVAGDEFARTQGGNNNPYNQDNETSWIDWSRHDEFGDHEPFVRSLIELRNDHDAFANDQWWGSAIEWFGASGGPDTAHHSRSVAWHLEGLYVMANMWWEPLEFEVQAPGPWRVHTDTTDESGDASTSSADVVGSSIVLGPRSIVVLVR